MLGALAAARVAHKLIDMREQKGAHPRIGAMDVCPFIPIKNISMEECIELSKRFGKLLSQELDVPVYLYGESQALVYRKELSSIRLGEYEMLNTKMSDPKFVPDFGTTEFRPKYFYFFMKSNHFFYILNLKVWS